MDQEKEKWTFLSVHCTNAGDTHADLWCFNCDINMTVYLKINLPINSLMKSAGVYNMRMSRNQVLSKFTDEDYELLFTIQRRWTPRVGLVGSPFVVRARWLNPKTDVRCLTIWFTSTFLPYERMIDADGKHTTCVHCYVEDDETYDPSDDV